MRYPLYDPQFEAEYLEDETLVIYHDNLMIGSMRYKGLESIAQLENAAAEVAKHYYPMPEYWSIPQAAELAGIKRQYAHFIVSTKLVQGYHFIMVNKNRMLTKNGLDLLIAKSNKDNKTKLKKKK